MTSPVYGGRTKCTDMTFLRLLISFPLSHTKMLDARYEMSFDILLLGVVLRVYIAIRKQPFDTATTQTLSGKAEFI
jgi:hypothetical protein